MREEANVRVSGEREASLPKRGHAAEKEKLSMPTSSARAPLPLWTSTSRERD
jgi:hypothetical protein